MTENRFGRIDLHTHSDCSRDADRDCTVARMCEAAVRNGVGILAVTDHYEIGYDYKFDPLARESAFAQAEETFAGQIRLLRGVELGEMLDGPEEAGRIRSAVPYDIVLGSLHAIRPCGDFHDLDFGRRTDRELLSFWAQYREDLIRLAEEGDFDALAHIRYPERYFDRNGRGSLLTIEEDGDAWFEPVLRALARRGLALEINTSVMRKNGLPADPGKRILQTFRALGGTYVTVGSDAHKLADIGAGVADALRMALESGFENVTIYEKRQPKQIPIADILGENRIG